MILSTGKGLSGRVEVWVITEFILDSVFDSGRLVDRELLAVIDVFLYLLISYRN